MRPRPVATAAALLLLLTAAGCSFERSWSRKLAELDRDSLNLALRNGADTGPELHGWVERGEVVEAFGRAAPGGDLRLTVRYERADAGWLGGGDQVERVCYRFSSPRGLSVSFARSECPAA